MAKFIDIKGNQFNRWTVVAYIGGGYWACKCSCGTEKKVIGYNLRYGISKSCGCWRDEKAVEDNTTHGLSDKKIYSGWLDMHERCYNVNNRRYKDWGGRGIKVCDRWNKNNSEGMKNFYEDIRRLGTRPGIYYTLDRIDNDKSYSPDNVHWASKKEQRTNQQAHRLRYLTYQGTKKLMKEWAKELKVHSSNILYWIKKGRNFEWVYDYYKNIVSTDVYLASGGETLEIKEWAKRFGTRVHTIKRSLCRGKSFEDIYKYYGSKTI